MPWPRYLQAELSEASSDEGGAEAGEGGEGSPGDSDDDMAAVAARLGRASSQGAQAAAKAAAAAAAATAVPFRKRLKRFVRAAAAAEAASTPVGSTGSRSRLGSASKPSQSVASSTPGSAGGLLIPKRAAAGPATPAGSTSFVKRRSEIDRRLDELVNASGRLRWVAAGAGRCVRQRLACTMCGACPLRAAVPAPHLRASPAPTLPAVPRCT